MKGKPLDEIVKETGVSKPYVHAICNLEDPTTLLGLQQKESFNGSTAGRIPETRQWNESSSVEVEYKNRRIRDLEDERDELRKKLSDANTELASLEKKHALLVIDHATIEQKHQYEKDNLIAQQNLKQTSGLNGLTDKVLVPILNNEKVVDALLLGITAKLTGGLPAPTNQQEQEPLHPLINDPEVGTLVREIFEVSKRFDKSEIPHLHNLYACFMVAPGLLTSVSKKTVDFLEAKQKQAQPTKEND